jgi:hypothetical protein
MRNCDFVVSLVLMNIQLPLSQGFAKIPSLVLDALDRIYYLLSQIGVFNILKLTPRFRRIFQEFFPRFFCFSYSIYLTIHRNAPSRLEQLIHLDFNRVDWPNQRFFVGAATKRDAPPVAVSRVGCGEAEARFIFSRRNPYAQATSWGSRRISALAAHP